MKKTYSRHNSELLGIDERKNTKSDPFDELLSSPLKQDIQFKPLSFWRENERKTEKKKKFRKVKYKLFESSESDEVVSPCGLSGLGDKQNSMSDSVDELLTPPQKQDLEFLSMTYCVKKRNDLDTQNKLREVKFGYFETSDSNGVFSPSNENSFLTGLQNVTKRRGNSNDSYYKSDESTNVNHSEIVDRQLENDQTFKSFEMTGRMSLQNVTKRKGISNDLYCRNYGDVKPKENEEIKQNVQPQIDHAVNQTQIIERISSQNVTKQRNLLNDLYKRNDKKSCDTREETEDEIKLDRQLETDQTLELTMLTERWSLDSNKTVCFGHPVLESTRVQDVSPVEKKAIKKHFKQSSGIIEDTKFYFDYTLKPGKEWLRSRSVIKQIQNRSMIKGRLENSRVTGRKFESFVQELLEMQNGTLGEYQSDNSAEDEPSFTLCLSDNCSFLSKSIPDKSMLEKSLLNYTVKVIQSEDKPSAFKSALGLETNFLKQDSIQHKSSAVSARDFVLIQCGQTDVLPFEEYFNERTLKNCKKIGEGVYGEVFMTDNAVIKIIPIEGSNKVNGEPQKTFEEIVSEVVIATKLSSLRNGEKHRTFGFSEVRRCWCVEGKYPKYLLELWDEYDQLGSGSENDSPIMFKSDQLFIILELANGGKDLESFVFSSSAQSLSVFIQASFSLAVAEKAFEFEHRDLHWGNVLITQTKDEFMTVLLNGIEYKIPTKGVKVCIIDFTLSRISHEGCCIFNDLSVDPGLFVSEGDYQFEIYRMMLKEVKNDWSLFRPRTNIYWLHYMLDKMMKMVRYKNRKAKLHLKHLKNLQTLEMHVLEHTDCRDFVLSDTLNRIRNNL